MVSYCTLSYGENVSGFHNKGIVSKLTWAKPKGISVYINVFYSRGCLACSMSMYMYIKLFIYIRFSCQVCLRKVKVSNDWYNQTQSPALETAKITNIHTVIQMRSISVGICSAVMPIVCLNALCKLIIMLHSQNT